MRSSQPPPVATWVLKHFGSRNEALTGDLVEEYRQGRSTVWYWRQVLMVVVVGCGNEIRTHKLASVRAIITGWAALILSGFLINLALGKLYSKALVALGLGPMVRALVALGLGPMGLWWRHYYTYAFIFKPCIGGFLSGWLVARLHRRHRGAMVFMFVISVLLTGFPEFFRLAADALGNSRFLPYLSVYSLSMGLSVVSILFGGLWSATTESARPFQ